MLGWSLPTLVALGAWLYWRSGSELAPAALEASAAAAAASRADGAAPANGGVEAGPSVGAIERQPAAAGERTAAAVPATFAQGLRGLVIDDNDQPLAGVEVYLLESRNDLLALPLLLQQRHSMGPLTTTQTGVDGTFAISLQLVQDKVYEVHVLSPDHATTRLGGLRLLAGQWHDLGAITLVAGATLRGRVTVEGREDIPVPLAIVTVETGTGFEDAALRSLPGQERGLSTTVDARGFYELAHAPSRGIVQVSAVAPGFARVLRQNIELSTTRPIEINFGLPPGQSLGGQIVDGHNGPVAGARIEAWPQHGNGTALLAQSDRNGRFEVLGLQTFPHRLRVLARGFQNHELRDQQPGQSNLLIALQARGTVRVRVITPNGAVLRSYQLSLRRYFEEQGGQIGLVVDVPEQRVRLDRLTDFAELQGVPTGTFACQVIADGYAKTLSAPIKFPSDIAGPTGSSLDGGGEVLSVDVTLSAGVTLRGRVVDEAGLPLAGATVTTQANGATPDHPLSKMLAGALPDKITAQTVTTAADGSFALAHLSLADYQLDVAHPDACRTVVPGLQLDSPGERALPSIRLVAGALVTGRATVAGRVAGQIKVVLAADPSADGGSDRGAVRIETVTDAEGHFQLPRRVPPGTYQMRAAVVGTAEPEAQIFRQLQQMRLSATTVSVAPGQSRVECNIDLPTDH